MGRKHLSLSSPSPRAAGGYLYHLPERGDVVQLVALAHALDAAYAAHRMHKHLDRFGIAALAVIGAQNYLRVTLGGKHGTNDQDAYYAMFRGVVERAYSSWNELFARSPWLVQHLSTFTIDSPAYKTELNRAALANLHTLATPADQPLVLTWPHPAEQKGGA